MKKYTVIALSVHSALTQKIYEAGDQVSEDCFPAGTAAKLVQGGFLEELPAKEVPAVEPQPEVPETPEVTPETPDVPAAEELPAKEERKGNRKK